MIEKREYIDELLNKSTQRMAPRAIPSINKEILFQKIAAAKVRQKRIQRLQIALWSLLGVCVLIAGVAVSSIWVDYSIFTEPFIEPFTESFALDIEPASWHLALMLVVFALPLVILNEYLNRRLKKRDLESL